jgi:predicted dehydrogenase
MRSLLLLSLLSTAAFAADDIKLGIIGLDTSHVVAFTKVLNDAAAKNHVPGARVVAAFKSFSPDIPSSADRVEGYTQELQEKFGVKITASIAELCGMVDGVLIENVDGRPHLEHARQVIALKKPLFIDKPIGGTLSDTLEIFRLAKAAGVPVFSSSAYRFYPSMVEVKAAKIGEVRSAISYGPASLEPHHPDLFWYGIHPTEALFTVMGRGCETVVRTSTADTDIVTGTWSGGRTGVLIGLRTKASPHKVTVFGSTGVVEQKGQPGDDYAPLVVQIVKFLQTGVPPVPAEETIEMFAFMQAADESKAKGGAPVKIGEVMAKAATARRGL